MPALQQPWIKDGVDLRYGVRRYNTTGLGDKFCVTGVSPYMEIVADCPTKEAAEAARRLLSGEAAAAGLTRRDGEEA
jgi:hypothetical protein